MAYSMPKSGNCATKLIIFEEASQSDVFRNQKHAVEFVFYVIEKYLF
jgi:hypothetical protein